MARTKIEHLMRPIRAAQIATLLALLVTIPGTSAAQNATTWWPASGAVILEGGHIEQATFDEFAKRLIALAGGPDALIVIIPTARDDVAPRLRGTGPPYDPNEVKKLMERKGAHRVTVLHTRDRD